MNGRSSRAGRRGSSRAGQGAGISDLRPFRRGLRPIRQAPDGLHEGAHFPVTSSRRLRGRPASPTVGVAGRLCASAREAAGFALTHLPLRCRMPPVFVRLGVEFLPSSRTPSPDDGSAVYRTRSAGEPGRQTFRFEKMPQPLFMWALSRFCRCDLPRDCDALALGTATVEKELYRWLLGHAVSGRSA
jgi:hypothetical protein